jgi:hypothetical protein
VRYKDTIAEIIPKWNYSINELNQEKLLYSITEETVG